MIITKDFIFINFPKTGSTFVRSVLKQLHHENTLQKYLPFTTAKKYCFEVKQLPQIRTFNKRYNQPTEHGIFSQIPSEITKNKTIVSVKRNIYDYYLSLYFYGDWKKHEASNYSKSEILNYFPTFPELSFDDFVRFMKILPFYDKNPKISDTNRIKNTLGPLSVQFVFFFFYKPFDFLNNIQNYRIEQLNYSQLMPKVHFLNQADLNNELHQFLKQYYPKSKIQFILEEKKKNVSNSGKLKISDINENTKQLILKNETLILNYFNGEYV